MGFDDGLTPTHAEGAVQHSFRKVGRFKVTLTIFSTTLKGIHFALAVNVKSEIARTCAQNSNAIACCSGLSFGVNIYWTASEEVL
jgi:hypothetical protein